MAEKKEMTYEEQLEIAQRRVAAIKAKMKKDRERKTMQVGQVIVDCFPEILEMMKSPDFKLRDFVKTSDFSRAFHFRFVQPDASKIPAWVNKASVVAEYSTTDVGDGSAGAAPQEDEKKRNEVKR